jgi:two-component system, NarL family, response regulator DevR
MPRAERRRDRIGRVPSPVRLFLVSPAVALRQSLARGLQAREDLDVVGEASSSRQGVSRVAAVRPDVVLAGAHMRDPDSIEMCRQLRTAVADIQVLLLALYPAQEFVAAAVSAGAAGVLPHTIDEDELVQAVQTAAAGQMVMDTKTLMRMLQDQRPAPRDPLGDLTPLERELFALVGRGLTNAEIAQALHLSPGTVRNYVSRLLRRLELDRRAQVVTLAARREFTGHAAG